MVAPLVGAPVAQGQNSNAPAQQASPDSLSQLGQQLAMAQALRGNTVPQNKYLQQLGGQISQLAGNFGTPQGTAGAFGSPMFTGPQTPTITGQGADTSSLMGLGGMGSIFGQTNPWSGS